MAPGPGLAELVQLGHDITSLKLYTISLTALWAYDYFLTVADEVRYTWKTENVPMFTLFLLNRYLPVPFLVWTTVASWSPNYTYEMCKNTAFIESLYYTLINASAQVVLTQRTYAVTRKNKWVARVLYTVATVQFGFGIHVFVHAVVNPAAMPMIPLELYRLCLSDAGEIWTIVLISLSLAFDVVVFVLVISQTQFTKSMYPGANVSTILKTVSRDAGIYFVIISSSHFLVVIMHFVARPSLRALPMVGNTVLIPIMITRMIISLKRVAASRQPHLNLEAPTGLSMSQPQGGFSHAVDGIRLSVLRSGQD